jgi:hypothetical protein
MLYQNTYSIVGYVVFTAVVMKSIIFWDMTPCSPLSFISTDYRAPYPRRWYSSHILLHEWHLNQQKEATWLSHHNSCGHISHFHLETKDSTYFHIPHTQCLYTGDTKGHIPLKCRVFCLLPLSIHIHLLLAMCMPLFNNTWITMHSLIHQNFCLLPLSQCPSEFSIMHMLLSTDRIIIICWIVSGALSCICHLSCWWLRPPACPYPTSEDPHEPSINIVTDLLRATITESKLHSITKWWQPPHIVPAVSRLITTEGLQRQCSLCGPCRGYIWRPSTDVR